MLLPQIIDGQCLSALAWTAAIRKVNLGTHIKTISVRILQDISARFTKTLEHAGQDF